MKLRAFIAFSCFFGCGATLHSEDLLYSVPATSASVTVATPTSAVVAVSSPVAPLAEEPFLRPVGPKAKVVSVFGKRPVPPKPDGTPASPAVEMHEGLDFRVAPGTPVHAARDGKVLFGGFSKTYASRVDKKEQSRFLIIRHADGKSTRYVHLNSLKVRPGQDVHAGDVIGTAAESDERKEPVLHFEIRDASGKALNPAPLLQDAKVPS